ncbi:MAG: PAS domain S-box protein, partial [Bryobacteraceae bacterium]
MKSMASGISHLGFGAEHEARLYQLLVKELTEYAIFFVNPNGRLASWNSGVERILGYPEDEFLDQPFSILFTPEDQLAGIPEQELAGAEEHGVASDERWHVRKSGERFFVSGLVIAAHGKSGEVVGCTKIMRDHTGRKQAEERLEEAYRKHKELACALDLTHMIIRDSDGKIRLWTQGAQELYGWTAHEALGAVSWELLNTEFPERLEEITDKLQREDRWQGELKRRSKGGREIFVASHWVAHYNDAGEMLIIEVNNDITERKTVEMALRESEETTRALLESAAQGVIGVDADGKMTMVNAMAEKLFGYQREELVGQPIEMLLPEGVRHQHVGHRADYFSKPRTRPMGIGLDLKARRKDGTEFPVEISLSHIETRRGPLAVSLITDITQRKQAEEALASQAEELRCTNEELRESEGTLRALLESAAQGVIGVDGQGKMTMVNAMAERLFGYRREELVGQPIEMLLPEGVRHQHVGHRADYFSRPRTRPMGIGLDLKARRKDGTE